jgi:PAT family beta-lactamase induction signal transducer AmpG
MTAPATPRDPAPPATGPEPPEPWAAKVAAAPWVLSTYFAEGLPFSIVRQVSSQFFTAMGASLGDIGATALYGLAWNFKLLWSPLVDRYGTTRRWLLVTQALLGLVIAGIALPAGERDLGAVARVLVVVAFLAATHDIAIDGFYLGALDKRGQAGFSGVRIAAYRAALLVGNGLLVMLAGVTSWRIVFLVAGGTLLLLAAAHAALLPRVAKEAAPRPAPDLVGGYVGAFQSFFAQPRIGVSLAFILLYHAGDALMFAMSAPFLRSLGFGDIGRGAVGTLGTIASIAGSITGGIVVARVGLARALPRIAMLQSLAIPLYLVLALTRPGTLWVGCVAVVEQGVAGVASSAFVVFLMRRCSPDHKAAHFAIATALMSVAATIAGYVSGHLAERVGFPVFFGLAFAASLPGVVLAWIVPRE